MRFKRHLIQEDVPWDGHDRPDTVVFRDGSIFSMQQMEGVQFETVANDLIVNRMEQLNQSFCQIANSSITMTVWQHREPASVDVIPTIPTDTPFATGLNLGYKAHLLDQSLYENSLFLSMQVRPRTYKKFKREIRDFLPWNQQPPAPDQDQFDEMDDRRRMLSHSMKEYGGRQLGVRGDLTPYSEIAETVMWMLTGQKRSIGLPAGVLGEAMFSEHVHVGWDTIKFIGPGYERYAAMLGIQIYPTQTHPFMLSQLLYAPYNYTIQHSFRFVPQTTALEIVGRTNFWHTKLNDPARKQVAKLDDLKEDLSNGRLVLGDYTCSMLVFANNEADLEKVIGAAWSDLAASGAKVVRSENLGLKSAYLGMIPGNEFRRPRSAYINSLNMACWAPMQCYPLGPKRGRWGGPIAVFRSRGGTPVYFHWHQDDVGNTLVTGPTGGGKTTLVGFLIAMTSGRARIIALDHKRGWQILFRALGGTYAVLGTGEPMFSPLKALSASPEDCGHIFDLLHGCIMADGGPKLSPDMERRLALGIRLVMSVLPPEQRSISEVCSFLGVDPNGPGARLRKWCWGEDLGWVLDAPTDALALSRRTGLDTTKLLQNERARGPAMVHLSYRIARELDGTPTLIPFDEGWRVIRDSQFGAMLEEQIRIIRSKNGLVVFITQGGHEIVSSGMAEVLISQCPNQIHLPNPRASREDYVDGLKLTEGEFHMLKGARKSEHEFLLRQGDESGLAGLNLDGLDDFVSVLSGSEVDLKLFEKAMAEADGDVTRALPIFHRARRLEGVMA